MSAACSRCCAWRALRPACHGRSILRRRDGYRAAYDDFDAERIARYDDARQAELLADARIIRNRLKVNAFRENARAVLGLRETDGGLDGYLWSRVDWQPVVNRFDSLSGIPGIEPARDRALA